MSLSTKALGAAPPLPPAEINIDRFKEEKKNQAPGAHDLIALLPLPYLVAATSLLSAAWLGFPVIFGLFAVYHGVKNWKKKEVIQERFTAVQNGSFVVFHIGANWNGKNKLNKIWKETGEAMGAMLKELDALPAEETGFLGATHYIALEDGHRLAVQYWRSMAHLQAYARGALHTPAWIKFKKIVKDNPDLCIFHESFEVQDGAYETIYVNSPPLLLANSRGASLYPCVGKYKGAKDRATHAHTRYEETKGSVEVQIPESTSLSIATAVPTASLSLDTRRVATGKTAMI